MLDEGMGFKGYPHGQMHARSKSAGYGMAWVILSTRRGRWDREN